MTDGNDALSPTHSSTELKQSNQEGSIGILRKRRLLQRSSTCRKAPHFALHKGIAIGFLKATDFRNKPKRTIFDVWCGDPH
jgi:hypothetical protein